MISVFCAKIVKKFHNIEDTLLTGYLVTYYIVKLLMCTWASCIGEVSSLPATKQAAIEERISEWLAQAYKLAHATDLWVLAHAFYIYTKNSCAGCSSPMLFSDMDFSFALTDYLQLLR